MAIGAATIGNARCLKTSYGSNSLVPVSCINGTWSAGSAVTMAGFGSPCSVGVSLDGIHSIVACDNSNCVSAAKFNTTSGLWEPNGFVSLPEYNLTNLGISPDGLRGMCVTKYSGTAYPLFRNPITNVWSAGAGIVIGPAVTRFFCVSFDPTGTVCLVGGNTDGVYGSALFWNGSAWTQVTIPFVFAPSRWLSDGTTVLACSGNASGRYILVLSYDPVAKTFSLAQTLTLSGGSADVFGVSVPELGRQDIALVLLFYTNQLLPLTKTAGSWSAGTPVSSPNFSNPLASVIMPLLSP